MVEWSCTKERLNERAPYIIAEWLYANKINRSVGTLNSGRMVVQIASAKIPGLVFMANCQTNSHTFSVLSTQWMSSP